MTHTPEPWAVGAQNDALYVTAGRAPALNNDDPWHEAPRVALAEMLGAAEGDCLPVNADANARRIVAAINATAGIPTEALEAGVVRELREENARLRQQIADLHNSINTVGSAYDKAVKACDEMVADVRRRTRAMLTKAGAA